MEQRIYRGNFTPDLLADYLVQHYINQPEFTAQKLGEGKSLIVQIGEARNHNKREIQHAVTIGIAQNPENETEIAVTLGEQQWLTPDQAAYAIAMGALALLFTPWILFALLWPAAHILGTRILPNDIWHNVETFVITQGGVMVGSQILQHPHLGESKF
jgi:hypothetical protein